MNDVECGIWKLSGEDSMTETTRYGDAIKMFEEFPIVFMDRLCLTDCHAREAFDFSFQHRNPDDPPGHGECKYESFVTFRYVI